MPDPGSEWHTVIVRVPFLSAEHANIAKSVIDVDKERQPDSVKRALHVDDRYLVASFSTLTVRLARLTVNGFLENVDLVVRTLEEFGDDAAMSAQASVS